MKLSKDVMLKNLRDMQLTEIALFGADMIDPMEHIMLSTAIQKLERRVDGDPRIEYEVVE